MYREMTSVHTGMRILIFTCKTEKQAQQQEKK